MFSPRGPNDIAELIELILTQTTLIDLPDEPYYLLNLNEVCLRLIRGWGNNLSFFRFSLWIGLMNEHVSLSLSSLASKIRCRWFVSTAEHWLPSLLCGLPSPSTFHGSVFGLSQPYHRLGSFSKKSSSRSLLDMWVSLSIPFSESTRFVSSRSQSTIDVLVHLFEWC